MAESHGAIKPAIEAEMNAYDPVRYENGSDISNRTFYGYNSSEDYYYCDPRQEYTVKLVTGDPRSNSEKDVITTLEALTGKPADYTRIQDLTMQELYNMNWDLPVVVNAYDTKSGNADKAHSLLVTNITPTSMEMYDPMDGQTYSVSSPNQTFDCGGYSEIIPRNFQHFK